MAVLAKMITHQGSGAMFEYTVKEYLYKPDLKLFVLDQCQRREDLKPAILFFHGAGFSNNQVNPSQFQHHANYFSSLGMVSICVQYRPDDQEGLYSPIKSIAHAKSSIRWVRQNASKLGVDPNRIVACGASAGGYLSLCCAMIQKINDMNDDLSVACKPDALVIFNGGVDSDKLIELFPDLHLELLHANPIDAVTANLPPSIFFHGTDDTIIPLESITGFVKKMLLNGNESKLEVFEGMGHGFFNYGNYENAPFLKTVERTKVFLEKHHILG